MKKGRRNNKWCWNEPRRPTRFNEIRREEAFTFLFICFASSLPKGIFFFFLSSFFETRILLDGNKNRVQTKRDDGEWRRRSAQMELYIEGISVASPESRCTLSKYVLVNRVNQITCFSHLFSSILFSPSFFYSYYFCAGPYFATSNFCMCRYVFC